MYNHSYPGQGYGHQQPGLSPNYSNHNIGNPHNQQYQPNGQYGNQSRSKNPQKAVVSMLQYFPTNYLPPRYAQQPVNSGNVPVKNQPPTCTRYGNDPQITYASYQATGLVTSSSIQPYHPPPNQPFPNAIMAVQQVAQPNYTSPQSIAQMYHYPNNKTKQQPGPPKQGYPPRWGYQPTPQGHPQGYAAPAQLGGYQQYSQRPLAPPSNPQHSGYPN